MSFTLLSLARLLTYTFAGIWDLVMDWSLMDPYAKKPFLRDVLGYKSAWPYYVAMIIDPILRFNWIFYAIFAHDLQHSAVLSFIVSLSEVLRRAMWTIFRVENEHCTNVGRFRASRDIPLPYAIESDASSSVTVSPEMPTREQQTPSGRTPSDQLPPTPGQVSQTTGADLEAQRTRTSHVSSMRRRKDPGTPGTTGTGRGTLSRVGTMLHLAHAQDFERKRKPEDDAGKDDDGETDEEGDSDGERERNLALEEGLLEGDSDTEDGGQGGKGKVRPHN